VRQTRLKLSGNVNECKPQKQWRVPGLSRGSVNYVFAFAAPSSVQPLPSIVFPVILMQLIPRLISPTPCPPQL